MEFVQLFGFLCFQTIFALYILLNFLENEKKSLLEAHIEIDQLKKEYHGILENMTEGVISKNSDYGLRYLNAIGLDLLK